MSKGPLTPSIPEAQKAGEALLAALRWLKVVSLVSSLVVASWAAVEVGLSARRSRDAFLDQGGAIRSAAVSADGRTIVLVAATGAIRSTDGGRSWSQCFPVPPPQAQTEVPAAAQSAAPPHDAPTNTELRRDAPHAPGGTAGRS